MSGNTFGARLRQARRSRGWTQAQLGASAGVARITVARLESSSGRDMRVGPLARLCAALGLELGALPAGELGRLQARLAREEERRRRLDRRRRHAELAVRLMTMPPSQARRLVGRARSNVDRWERERLCSRHYVTRWRRRLQGGAGAVARSLVRADAWADALFQNSPWGFALGPPEA